MECRECLVFRDHKDRREGMGLKDRLVTRDRKECWDRRRGRKRRASREKRTTRNDGNKRCTGNCGIKGDKGEKGESVRSPLSAVPQTNWKQCVWKASESKDSGKIKVREKCTEMVLS